MTDDSSQQTQLPTSTSSSQSATSVNEDRLSLSTPLRLTYSVLGGFATGLFLGLSHGSQTAGLRFRAENAHRLPTTQKGWYFYHKSKNYHVMLGGFTEGLKLAPKLSLWTGSFFAIEAIVDNARGPGGEDFLSTTVATLTVSGAWSLWSMSYNQYLVESGACRLISSR